MLFYPAALPLSRQTLTYTAGVIRRHRRQIGSPWRKLNPGQQALLVLAYLRGETYPELAAGFGRAMSRLPQPSSCCVPELGQAALRRFDDVQAAGEAEPVLVKHLSAGFRSYQQSLDLTPADDHDECAISENQIGIIYRRAWDTA